MDIHSLWFFLATNGLSIGAFSLQSAMVLRMNKSKLRQELPMFYAYVVFSLLQSVGLFTLRNYFGFRSQEYFIGYWLTFVVDTTLAFFIIQEVYAKALYHYPGLRTLSAMIFRWAFLILVLVAVVTTLSSPRADNDFMYSCILLLSRSAMIVEFGLVVLLFALAHTFSLGWRECIFGIAVGMCFYCSMQLAAVSLRTHYGSEFANLYVFIKPLISVTTLGIWTAYVYRSERARSQITPFKNTNLDEWNTAVLQFLNR